MRMRREQVPEAETGLCLREPLRPPDHLALFRGLFLFQQKSSFDEAQKNSTTPPCRAPGALRSAGVDL